MLKNFLEMLKMQILRYYTDVVSIRCVLGGNGEEEDGGGLEYLFITHSGDGDECGLRNTLRLIRLVEDTGFLLCWRKSGWVCGRSTGQRQLIQGMEEGSTTEGFPNARGINVQMMMERPWPG